MGGGGGNPLDPGNIGPVGQGALALFSRDPVGTLGKLAQARQANAQQSDVASNFGGYDPKSGIYWNEGRGTPDPSRAVDAQGNPAQIPFQMPPAGSPGGASPIAGMMQDPMVQMAARLDPKGTLSTIFSRVMAPPETYQVTDPQGNVKSQLLTPMQAIALQGKGYQIAASNKANPVDPNTPIQIVVGANGNQEQQYARSPGTGSFTPIGQPGKFINLPLTEPGKLQWDLSQSFGGGSNLGTGSGAPSAGRIQPATPMTQAGGSSFTEPAIAPLAAASTAPAPGGAVPRAPGIGALPSMQDIFRTAMIKEARLPEQQAELNAAGTAKGNGQFDTVQVPDPSNPGRMMMVLKSSLPNQSLGQGGLSPAGELEQKANIEEGALRGHMQALDALKQSAQSALDDPALSRVSGAVGAFPSIPGSPAARAQAKLDLVKNQSVLNVFQSARDMSKTGGGVGRLTETEIPLFQNSLAALQQSQDEGSLRKNLQSMIDYADMSKNNLTSTFKDTYGREFRPAQSGTPAGKPSTQDIVDELRRRGVVK